MYIVCVFVIVESDVIKMITAVFRRFSTADLVIHENNFGNDCVSKWKSRKKYENWNKGQV